MRTLVVRPVFQGRGPERDSALALDEAVALAEALELDIVRAELVPVSRIKAGTLFGAGKVEHLASLVSDLHVGLLIVDGALTPVQQRNLERDLSCKVLDRTGLILEIFGERARTREGVLQVELAHLSYQKSRLVRSWTHLERQRGGFGFLGGPGETQIEADRRALDERIVRIKTQLERVRKTRDQQMRSRRRSKFPVVALVGYTNAGKSTLFNTLTQADILAKDMLFATLDTTMRAAELPDGQRIILSDTVGFVADLPTQLIAAFRGTLEEILDADLVLHVRDISHPESKQQSENVESILRDLGFGDTCDTEILEVWNKADLIPDDDIAALQAIEGRSANATLISATTGQGMDRLLHRIQDRLSGVRSRETVELKIGDGRSRSWLFGHSRVLGEEIRGDRVRISVDWTQKEKSQFSSYRESAK